MKQQQFNFTKDYLSCIAQAGLFTYSRNEEIIHPDDVFLGTRKFLEKKSYGDLFRKILGCTGQNQIAEYIQRNGLVIKKPEGPKMKFQLDGVFRKEFNEYKKNGTTTLDFMILFQSCLNYLSDDLLSFLQHQDISHKQMIARAEKVVAMNQQTDIKPLEFFEMIENMVTSLGVDLAQMEMFFDMDQIVNLEEMMNEKIDLVPSGSGGEDKKSNSNVEGSKDTKEKKLTIEYFATDLTNEAKEKLLDPVIGRDKEIQQIIYTLMRKTKNNPLLVGEAGVGKTAIVEGFAQKIVLGEVPHKLQNKKVMMLDIGSLVAGTKYRGEFESRLKSIIEEAIDPLNNIILFVDEAHSLIGAGNAEGSADAANMLKPLLSRGKLQMIGATTFDEYQKHIEKDPALKRRFQEVTVEEPNADESLQILEGIKKTFEEYHGVNIDDDALQYAVLYSTRYIMNRYLPDKAIDLVDEAAARVSTIHHKLEKNSEYARIEKKIKIIQERIEKAIEKQDYFKAAELKDKEIELKDKLVTIKKDQLLPVHLRPKVTKGDIGKVLSDKMGLPLETITTSEVHQLRKLDETMKGLVLSQDEAVDAVVKAIRRSKLSPVAQKKPIASFLFLGPSGVGKTYLAKVLAKDYFGDEKSLIRVDMSELMERHSVSKLIGSAPGYVGYEEGGMLTEQVRRRPYSVVLFDEIEKASPDVLNILLQILDEGHVKDNKGRRIDFKNTVIIMTSNIGASEFGEKQVSMGFSPSGNDQTVDPKEISDDDIEVIRGRVMEEVEDYLTPELINRLSSIILFRPLSKKVLGDIFKKEVKEFLSHWKKNKAIKIPVFTGKRIKKIVDEIYNPLLGARPINRYIHDEIEPKLIEQVLKIGE